MNLPPFPLTIRRTPLSFYRAFPVLIPLDPTSIVVCIIPLIRIVIVSDNSFVLSNASPYPCFVTPKADSIVFNSYQ